MWRWIILSSVLAQQILEITASLLNLCNLSPHLPLEFEDTFEPVKYAESQRYTKAKSWFGLLQSVFSTTAFIAFWFAGGFNALDQFTGSFGVSKSSAVVHGLIYIGMLSAMSTVISLPFSLYYDFVLERRFGFNKKTFLTFVKDLCLMTILVILLGGPLLALILYFFQATGSRAWIFCWSVTVAFSVFMVFITPKYILPLFNKLDPLPQDALKERIEKLASDLCFSFKGIFVMDGSKRSSHSNAFFTGFGSTKCIVLFDTLIEQQTHDEIISVLGHEIGHYKMRHIIWTMIFSILQQGLMFYVMQFFISSEDLADAFFMSNTSTHTGLIFFSQLVILFIIWETRL